MQSKSEQKILSEIRNSFGQENHVFEMRNNRNSLAIKVFEFQTIDAPCFCELVSCGGYEFPMFQDDCVSKIRVELHSTVHMEYAEIMAHILAESLFSLTDSCRMFQPEHVLPLAVAKIVNSLEVKHLFFADPLNLPSIQLSEGKIVAFLRALPITDDELDYLVCKGGAALSNYFDQVRLPYFDLQRSSSLAHNQKK